MCDQVRSKMYNEDASKKQIEYCTVASIGATYGVEGWVRLTIRCESRERFLQFNTLYIYTPPRNKALPRNKQEQPGRYPASQSLGQWYPFEFEEIKEHGRGLIAKISGCTVKEQAAQFTGKDIGILQSELPELEVGDYYWSDLIGMLVYSDSDELLGVVESLMETGSNDVLVVRPTADSLDQDERLIPYLLGSVVKNIDQGKNHILVEWDSQF